MLETNVVKGDRLLSSIRRIETQQANARLVRQGQTNTVRIYHIITENTVDERVLEVLKGKNLRQEELLRKLKAELLK